VTIRVAKAERSQTNSTARPCDEVQRFWQVSCVGSTQLHILLVFVAQADHFASVYSSRAAFLRIAKRSILTSV